jgi:ABC1 atypical kinase-like domain
VKRLPEEERNRFGEIVFRFCFGSIYHLQHFNADSHPGNYLLMEDGRVAFLDFGMTKKLDREQIELEQVAFDAAARKDPEALRLRLHDLGFIRKPTKLDAEQLMDHVMLVGGWYIEDGEYQVSARRVMKIIESASDPRSEYFGVMRRENIPADELMGRRMEIGLIAVLSELAPDHARVGLRRGSRDRARTRGVGLLRVPRGQADSGLGFGRTPMIAITRPTRAIAATTRRLS